MGKKAAGVIQDVGGKLAHMSPADIAQAMKDALVEGISYAIEKGSDPQYFKEREDIRIRFPEPLKDHKIEGKLRMLEGSVLDKGEIDEFLDALNYAASISTGVCRDIFEDAVKEMSFSQCKALVLSKNPEAITEYLAETCGEDIRSACMVPIDEVCDGIPALKLWEKFVKAFNSLPLMPEIKYDCRKHVCDQTVRGILVLIAEKEMDIRENPMQCVKESIQGIFGAAKEAFDDYKKCTGEVKGQFEELDSDKDGTLSFEELKDLFQELNADMSDHDLNSLYRAVDVDQNGKVSRDEFVDWLFCQNTTEVAVANGAFEDGSNTSKYEYKGEATDANRCQFPGWAGEGRCVFIKSGNAYWGGTHAAKGSHYLGLQNTNASIEQEVMGHVFGGKYELHFKAAIRPNYAPSTISVFIDGEKMEVPSQPMTSNTFMKFEVPYTANDGTVKIKFMNDTVMEPSATSHYITCFLDDIHIVH